MKKKRTKVKCISLMEDGRYYLEITLTSPNGKRVYRRHTCPHGLTLDEAQVELVRFRAQQRAQLQQQDQGLAQVITVADYAERWLPIKAPDLGASTTDRYVRDLSHHILPVLGEKRIRSLTRIDVKAWVAHAQAKRKQDGELYSWETLEGWWRILRQLLQDARVDLSMAHDSTERVRGPKRRPGRVREEETLTRDQLAALLEAVRQGSPNRYAEVLCLACTGMRPGEMYALRVHHIDSSRRRITIETAHWRGQESGQTKGVDPRVVYAPPELLDALAKHRRHLLATQHPGLRSGLLFPSRKGTHRNSGSLAKPLAKACMQAGIVVRVSAQVLRRTFNTLMVEASVDRAVLWSMIGHSDERLTKRYAGVSLEAKRQAVESVILMPGSTNVAPKCCTTEQEKDGQETTKPLNEGLG